MSKVLLCGHTGSYNRGCEAILRSTNTILKKVGVEEIEAMTFAREQDEESGIDRVMKITPYAQKPLWVKVLGKVRGKLTGNFIWSQRYLHKNIDFGKNLSCLFNVGGDTYCYQHPYISYALNELAEENGVKNIFWGCSVDERVLKDRKMQEDINRYSYIFARECLSYELLEKILKDKTKLYKVCDPAFHLEKTETPLPEGFEKGNCVGINISPLVFKSTENSEDIMYRNIRKLVSFIIENTNMSICFIPHVYDFEKNTQDIKILRKIYEDCSENNRISLVDKALSCTELKYIISNCRFFIGARTHTTIAAYSSKVPCIAISYSIKSRGIARDLFGKEEGYVIKWQDIEKEDELTRLLQGIIDSEEEIRNRYDEILPSYVQSILDKTEKVWREINAK